MPLRTFETRSCLASAIRRFSSAISFEKSLFRKAIVSTAYIGEARWRFSRHVIGPESHIRADLLRRGCRSFFVGFFFRTCSGLELSRSHSVGKIFLANLEVTHHDQLFLKFVIRHRRLKAWLPAPFTSELDAVQSRLVQHPVM